jgi:hypothetical protein
MIAGGQEGHFARGFRCNATRRTIRSRYSLLEIGHRRDQDAAPPRRRTLGTVSRRRRIRRGATEDVETTGHRIGSGLGGSRYFVRHQLVLPDHYLLRFTGLNPAWGVKVIKSLPAAPAPRNGISFFGNHGHT